MADCVKSLTSRPTKRAPDGWWAPRFGLDSSKKFGSVSLVGSLQPPVTQAVGRQAQTHYRQLVLEEMQGIKEQ